jgi:Cu-Zn family superoxide dismutase
LENPVRAPLRQSAFVATLAAAALLVPTALDAHPARHARHAAKARPPLARAKLMLADGTPAGTATVRVYHGRASLVLALSKLPAGVHGIHLHAVGKCDAPDFKTAGGHLNPDMHQHGTLNPMGHHLGDLANITVNAGGKVNTSMPLVGGEAAVSAAMFDADGTSLVIHAAPDDYKTDPSGNSGARIACGVFEKR